MLFQLFHRQPLIPFVVKDSVMNNFFAVISFEKFQISSYTCGNSFLYSSLVSVYIVSSLISLILTLCLATLFSNEFNSFEIITYKFQTFYMWNGLNSFKKNNVVKHSLHVWLRRKRLGVYPVISLPLNLARMIYCCHEFFKVFLVPWVSKSVLIYLFKD